jgi:hypothetical protein
MGAVMDTLSGGGATDVSKLKDMSLQNQTGLNMNFGQQIAAHQADPSAQFRQAQAGLATQLQAQAAGQGPSLAQGQLNQATNDNINSQMAMAASGHGMSGGMAQRLAAQNLSSTNQQAAGQSAQMRMQEQLAAQGQLANVAAQARSGDISNQQTNDSFTQGMVGLANQRDLGQMNGQISAQKGAADIEEQGKKRSQAAIGGMMSGAGAAMSGGML